MSLSSSSEDDEAGRDPLLVTEDVLQMANYLLPEEDLGRRRGGNRAGRLSTFPKLPVPPTPLEHEHLRYELEQEVSDDGMCTTLQRMSKSVSFNNALKRNAEGTELPSGPHESGQKGVGEVLRGGVDQPWISSMLKQYFSSPIFGCSSSSASAECPQRPACQCNAMDLIMGREAGLGRTNKWSLAQKRGAVCPLQLPCKPKIFVDKARGHAYTCSFSEDGELFVAGFQDQRILVYRPGDNWEIQKHITARMLRWTITDTAVSSDGGSLLYSTISPVLHLVKLSGEDSVVDSQANITEIHEPVFIGEDERELFGIWSMAWSRDTKEIVVGTNAAYNNIQLYDMEQQCTLASVSGHTLDVNAVAFMDEASQVFASGSDDSGIKIWDKRTFGQSPIASGSLVGHLEGITHIDTKGDGRYLISNCKDQTIKLWDVRKLVSAEAASAYRHLKNSTLPNFMWDYRWNEYPARGYLLKHPRDSSLMTFRGHIVLQTLIRAYFSPSFTTGQRYVYCGCRNGTVRIFDILTGETVQELVLHKSVVRDCAWHPYEPLLVSSSWDGYLVEWTRSED